MSRLVARPSLVRGGDLSVNPLLEHFRAELPAELVEMRTWIGAIDR